MLVDKKLSLTQPCALAAWAASKAVFQVAKTLSFPMSFPMSFPKLPLAALLTYGHVASFEVNI